MPTLYIIYMGIQKYIILFIAIFPLLCSAHEGRHILYINSYSPNFPTYEKIKPVLDAYAKETNNQIETQFLYAKKYNSSDYIPILKERFEYVRKKCTDLDLVLVSDDFALQFVLQMQDSLFQRIPIVFWGINNKELAHSQDTNKFVTGVVEDISVYETIKHANELNPNLQEIIAITDDTETGLADKRNFFAEASKFPKIKFTEMDFSLYKLDRFLNEIDKIKGNKAFLLLSGFIDAENKNYTFEYSLKKIIEKAKIPVYHLWEHGLGDGIAGGKLISHANQAKTALLLVDSIFNGTSPAKIKVIKKSPNTLVFDFEVLKKFGLYLANISEHARLINQPQEIIFISKNTFYIVAFLLTLVVLIIFILAYNLQIKRKLEKELSEARDRYESLFRTSYSIMLLIEPETGDILDANEAACRYYGYTYEEITRINISNINILTPEQITVEIQKAFTEQRNHFEFKHRLANGEIRDIESYAGKVQIGGKIRLYSIVHDITQRKRAEQELLHSRAIISENEQKYRGLFENTPIGIIYMNLDGDILDINTAMLNMVGSPGKEASLGENILSQDSILKFSTFQYFEQCIDSKQNVVAEFPYYSRFGKNLYLKSYLSPVFDNGKVIGVQAAIEDITERNEAETKIRQSETQFRLLAENVPGTIYLCENDANYTMIYLNDEIEKLTGYAKELFLNGAKTYDSLIHPEDFDYVRGSINDAVAKLESFRIEYRIQGITGNYKWVEENGIGLYENDRLIWLEGFILDITARKYAEEELTKMAKLESLSVLASGIAHNFKNMLASISLSVDLARRKPDKLNIYADRIEKTIAQANAIALRFQTFSSGGEPVREIANVCEVIDESLSIALGGTNVQHINNYDRKVWNVEIDTKQITEVFTNLFLNSKQAMENKQGKIYVDVENCTLDNPKVNKFTGDFVKISVRDEGIGIPENIISKVFDPFFTTKDNGHGLGLATVNLIIKKHKGFIKVHSQENIGTEFNIFLPANKNGIMVKKQIEEKIIRKNSYRILLMDDDDALRISMTEILELSGHNVVSVSKGETALIEYQKAYLTSRPFDLAILDLTIVGGMEGEETLNKLLVLNPEIRAIVCSAHSDKSIVANYRDYGFSGRITKPINFDGLLEEIERVMSIRI